jgi:hypothetical protein
VLAGGLYTREIKGLIFITEIQCFYRDVGTELFILLCNPAYKNILRLVEIRSDFIFECSVEYVFEGYNL